MPNRNRKREERYNVITHGTGTLLSIAACISLLYVSVIRGSTMRLAVSVIFGGSLLALYTASTLYHATTQERWKRLFNLIDHLCIYILIAGTYTPIALLGLKGKWGWFIFTLVWLFAALGFFVKLSPLRRNEKWSLASYLMMGWFILIALKPLLQRMPTNALWLMLGGGLCYTIGTYFFIKDHKPYYHCIWHLFVLGGSAFHFFAIFIFLIC